MNIGNPGELTSVRASDVQGSDKSVPDGQCNGESSEFHVVRWRKKSEERREGEALSKRQGEVR